VCSSDLEALAYVREQGAPIVLKADGLAAGKGVIVAMTLAEAEAAVADILGGKFGSAGARLVVEEFLTGEEASFIVMCDGEHAFALATSQDHKRVGDGDTGPNTGGMGAYSPAPVVTPDVHARVMREIIAPVLKGMKAEGTPYTGFLYAGLMINAKGEPRVVEFNCRMGDPETQPIFLRMKGDFTVLLEHAVIGTLDQAEHLSETLWDSRAAVGVVLAAQHYPETPKTGDVISGLPADADDAVIFHAGTKLQGDQVVTNGGRVLCATALGSSIKEAQARAYQLALQVCFDGMHYRKDIGWRALK
jgi:phosphoribosylamine--glycine ligase